MSMKFKVLLQVSIAFLILIILYMTSTFTIRVGLFHVEKNIKENTTPLLLITPSPIPTVIPTATAIATATPTPIPIYIVPLSNEDQQYTFQMCKKNQVPYTLILSIMSQESDFRQNLVHKNSNGSTDYGLLQINSCHFEELKEKGYDLSNILDPKVNINAGTFLIGRLYNIFKNRHQTLMAWNMGTGTMKKLTNRGITSSFYSRSIVKKEKELITHKKIKE